MIRRALIAALLLCCGVAQAQWGSGFVPKSAFGPPPPATCQRGAAFVDGCPGAPSGTAQQPTLLNSYATRPPWNVAGVDYHTGYPTGTSLADPATISISGVTVNAGAHTVTVNGSNITLDGYNFGLANGWTVTVNGANDTIQNSLFKVGTNQGSLGTVLNVTSAASNFSFLANEVDGNNIAVTAQQGFTLGFVSTGTLTIQYNYLHNSGGDMVEVQEGNWTNQKIRYNYFENIGYNTDHSDTIQWCASVINAGDMAFNTVNNPSTTQSLSGEGLLVLNSECGPPNSSQASNIQNTTVRNNTLISKGPQDDFDVGQTVTQDAGTASGDHNATYDNYADPAGVNNFTGSPWFPTTGFNTSPTAALGTPAAIHTLTNMLTNTQIAVPTTSSRQGGYSVYPDVNNYSPCLCDIFGIVPSPASGNITTGNTITFAVTMDAPTTVTGTPTMALNSGGSAHYVSGSGTKVLTFSYTVGSGDSAATLAVNSFSGTMKDDVGNATLVSPLTNLTTSFTGLSVNSAGNTLAFTSLTSAPINGTTSGSGTYTGSAPSGLTNVAYGGGCTGPSTVSGFSASGGNWSATFTTPSAQCTGTLSVTGTGSNMASGTSPSTIFGAAGSCPDNDGSGGASAGSPQLPTLLAGYAATINGPHGLGCKVAGVDYHVGAASTTSFVVPTSGNLPSGATISGNVVTINANNVTFQGFDMTGKSLQTGGGIISGTVVQNNKFVVTSCVAPPIQFQDIGGTTTIQYNNFDGGGALCGLDDNPGQGYSNGSPGDMFFQNIEANATLTIQYNYQANTNQDNIDIAGPGSGTAAFFDQYNVFNAQGWGGHPDGIQFCGGNFASPTIRHNTLIQPSNLVGTIDTQPTHVEAQCSPAGKITNALVTFNTYLLPSSTNCTGGNFPGGCTANGVISCKNDNPPSTTNSGFKAYGNYMDWTTALINLDDGNACTTTTWGSPYANYDMKAGTVMTVGQIH